MSQEIAAQTESGHGMFEVLKDFDAQGSVSSIVPAMQVLVRQRLHRRGAVVAVSGGVDSSVCLALCVQAFGAENTVALFLPDRDSSGDSRPLVQSLCNRFKARFLDQDITPVLDALGAYRAQAEAVKAVFPEYQESWTFKLALPSILETNRLNLTRLIVRTDSGETLEKRLSAEDYLLVVAATNFKQRVRTMLAYFHADRLNYAVCGTPNRLEYDQGFFVKGGDGLADFKPIAHLYKTQVFSLARHLGVPEQIVSRPPTTDTFSLPQSQEEFYFSVPYHILDVCLLALNSGISDEVTARETALTVEQVRRVWGDIRAKRRATSGLHLTGLLVGDVPEV